MRNYTGSTQDPTPTDSTPAHGSDASDPGAADAHYAVRATSIAAATRTPAAAVCRRERDGLSLRVLVQRIERAAARARRLQRISHAAPSSPKRGDA